MTETMDRDLSFEYKRRQRRKACIIIACLIFGLIAAFFLLRNSLKPDIERSKITIDIAEKGTIEATIPASGTVIADNEFVITSPIHAKIEKVLYRPGDAVQAGESLLQLNREAVLTAYDKLIDEQEVNRNKINQLKLNLERSLSDLHTQYSIKEMRIQSLEADLEHERSLLKIGGGTADRVKQAELNLNIARLELRQVKNQINNQQKTTQADLKNLGFQISIHEKSIAESRRKLNRAEVRSPGKGIITWVSDQIGAEINEGAEIVRIADLSSFKVEGSVADSYASRVKMGGGAIVRINDTDIRGKIVNVEPAVKDGTVKFIVDLNQKSHPQLRSNLKAEIFIITSVKENAIRVKNGAAFDGSARQKIFVVNGKEATSRLVTVGESNFDYIEITSGLKAGEKVIVANMQDFIHHDKVHIKN